MNLSLNLKPLVGSVENMRWFGFGRELPDETIEAYQARMDDESFLVFVDMLALALPRPAKVKTPLLVLGGAADFSFARQRSKRPPEPTAPSMKFSLARAMI